MWDLVKGKCTFIAKLESEAEGVAFSPSGARYALRAGPRVTLHSVGADAAAGPAATLDHPSRVLCMAFGDGDGVVVTGAEDGSLRLWDAEVRGKGGQGGGEGSVAAGGLGRVGACFLACSCRE